MSAELSPKQLSRRSFLIVTGLTAAAVLGLNNDARGAEGQSGGGELPDVDPESSEVLSRYDSFPLSSVSLLIV